VPWRVLRFLHFYISMSKERTLKIEATGDFWRRRIKPKIRLYGYWLRDAGFEPGQRVRVTLHRPGELTLQRIQPPAADPDTQA
jgi:hypothetical protein